MSDALPTELTRLMSIFKVNLVPRVVSYSSLQGKNPGERGENPGNEVVFKVRVLEFIHKIIPLNPSLIIASIKKHYFRREAQIK